MGNSRKLKIIVGVVLGTVVLGVILLRKPNLESPEAGGREQTGASSNDHSSSKPNIPNSGTANSGTANSDASPVGAATQGQANSTDSSNVKSTNGDENGVKPDVSVHRQDGGSKAGNESSGTLDGKAPKVLPSENSQNASSANGKPLVNLKTSSSANDGNLAGGHEGQTVATTTPSKTATGAGTNTPPASSKAPVKERPDFPGITQAENDVMVSDVNYKGGEGEDYIIVTLTQVHGAEKKSGKLWVIGEYVQRGTTGIMFMPSHKEMKLAPDGTPNNPKIGNAYQLKTVVKTSVTVRKPGFEGEELMGVRIGVVDGASGVVHYAKISMKHIQKRPVIKRIKVSADEVKK